MIFRTQITIPPSDKNVVALPRPKPLHHGNKMHLATLPLFIILAAFTAVTVTAADVVNTTRYHHDALGLTLLSGETRLPADGNWTLTQPPPDSGLRQIFYDVTNREALHADGVRSLANRIEDRLRDDRWLLARHHTLLRNYAEQHADHGPARFDDPALLELVAYYDRVRKPDEKPLSDEEQARHVAEFREKIADIGLVPNVIISFVNPFGSERRTLAAPATPLLLELTPALDDGQHWVLYNDGNAERVPIDTELLQRLGLTISKKDVINDTVSQRPTEQVIQLYAQLANGTHRPAALVFKDSAVDRSFIVNWDWSDSTPGAREQLSTWAGLRASEWISLADVGEAPILHTWLDRVPTLYGAKLPDGETAAWFNPETSLSLFALFGGRAAVQETLQTQTLATRNDGAATLPPPLPPVALVDVPGVEVRSHPFAEMTRGKTLPALPLANLVPADRAFFYAAKPAALNQFFTPDSAFVRRVAAFSGPGANYGLRDRYSTDLGLTSELIDTLLDSGLIVECAIFTPDVFFADGTDITVVTRVRSGALLGNLLKPVLSTLPAKDGIYTVPTATGSAYWAISDDVWLLSTHAGELHSALALSAQNGTGSLGRSDEFRYMLHELPPIADTRAYVYFSDAFIRRLVGPAVKIAQTRRIKARLAMEQLVAAALLRRLDAPDATITVEELARLGYFQSVDLPADTTLNTDFSVSSATFGPLARMKPLSAQAASITRVTADEADAYKRYLETYTNFWSRYFDPIALRLDSATDEQHSLTTFILPLVENTAYNDLREWLRATTPTEAGGVTPVFNRTPVAQLDLTFTEETWRSIARGAGNLLEDYVSLDPEFYDLLGPAFHIAFENSESVIRLDSAEAASLVSPLGRRNSLIETMFFIPAAIHFFTRPTHIAIELTHAEQTARLLDKVHAKTKSPFDDYVQIEFYRHGNDQEWLLGIRPFNIASINFSVRIDGRYLIISNNPANKPLHVTGVRPARPGVASLAFHPQNRATDLPADFTSAMRVEHKRALIGMGHVYPWMLCFGNGLGDATRQHARVLGFTPSLPSGELSWKGDALEHSVFGSVKKPRLPAYDSAIRFGLFENLSDATVSMQFEDDGLRTELRWRLLSPTAEP